MIREGSTFCVSDETGDIAEPTMGLFASDTRFLSHWIMRVNGERPLLLSWGKVEYYSAAFYLRNPIAGGLGPDEVSIARERFVGEGMQDHVQVRNHTRRTLEFELAFELGNDFADIFAVKEYDFALGDPENAAPLPPSVEPRYDERGNQFILTDYGDFEGITQVVFSGRGEVDGAVVRYPLRLAPGEVWRLRVDVVPAPDGTVLFPHVAERRFGEERARLSASITAWNLRVPQLRASWRELDRSFAQSVADLASLRMSDRPGGLARLPAAGMPWFMTVFGRDTIVTSIQTLLFGPELAAGALRVVADLQATEDDPEIDAEPGKIVHEVRQGKAASTWFRRYYGTVDATPLYLVLLSEVWRWAGGNHLLRHLRAPAPPPPEWIGRYCDSG